MYINWGLVVLYNIKLSIERNMEDRIKAYRSYEKTWFQFKGDPERVVIECACKKCEYYTPIAISIMEYRERSLYSHINPSNLSTLNLLNYHKNRSYPNENPFELSATCQACKTPNSLRLSFFGYE
jgi:hypothetical protein